MQKRRSTRRLHLVCHALALFLFATGCSTIPTDFPRIVNEPAPVDAATRARFGRIAVLPPAAATNVYFSPPADKGQVFQRVAGKAFDTTMEPLDHTTIRTPYDLGGVVLYVGVMGAVSLTAGAIAGAIIGVTDREFQACETAFRTALEEEPMTLEIQRALTKSLGAAHATNVSLLPEQALTKLGTPGGLDLHPLAADGFDSVLDIRVMDVGFEFQPGYNPDLSFAPKVSVRVIRIRDGAVLHASSLDYRGSKRPITRWAESNARPFRKELRKAGKTFAAEICAEYF